MIFKREKELARKLEFDGLYITEQPEDDDIKGQWDRLVLNTPYANTETVPFLVPFRYLIKQPNLNQDSVIINVTNWFNLFTAPSQTTIGTNSSKER